MPLETGFYIGTPLLDPQNYFISSLVPSGKSNKYH